MNYHRLPDEYNPNWDLSGAVEDLQLMFAVGYNLGNTDVFPDWNKGSEFKALRDSIMKEYIRFII